jgi:carbamoyltransferase
VGDLGLYAERLSALTEPLDVVVECYSSDPEFNRFDEYRAELDRVLKFRNGPRVLQISHHLAHLYSAFFTSPFDDAAVMVIDCMGSPVEHFTEHFPTSAPLKFVEVASFYRCSAREVRCLAKQLWDIDWARPVGLGCFYFLLTRAMFFGDGNEGKVMGLAPYGDPGALGLPPLTVERGAVTIPPEWTELFRDPGQFRYFIDGSGSFERCAHLAAAGQKCFEDALLELARWIRSETGSPNLCFVGGTALNCVANGRLIRESGFKHVFIPSSPHDGGTALGCAVYGWVDVLGRPPEFRWVNDFLGPEPPEWDASGLTDGAFLVERPADLIERTAELLDTGRVIALFHGRSELGPRALGHRSILSDPRRAGARDWINRHVKGREMFRPLAPAVRAEVADRYFEIDRPVPFMQFASSVRPECRATIPAVTHVDGTARLQTVTRSDDPFFYDLILAFEARTGVGVLLNTSFNGPGEPIIETPDEAVACFRRTPIHALVLPPYLIRKREEVPGPN